ncbi:MAG: LptF/LptG family permease [Capnocytophaga sp.]|nr:LptF/LptG family permease [Capnocytophaga sp.]
MKILDWYILKRYFLTFSGLFLMFIPIGILVDYAEKSAKMARNNAPTEAILWYYLNFIVHFANILFPIFLFLSVIWFTSKLAERTEIVAMLSSGISYNRFLRPYLYGALILSVFVILMGMFVVPYSSKVYNEFYGTYLSPGSYTKGKNLYNQISENEYIYVSDYDATKQEGRDFTLEYFQGNQLQQKISASSIQFIQNDSITTYRLTDYVKRTIGEEDDKIVTEYTKDTLFNFKTSDLLPIEYAAETKNFFELNKFIDQERQKGSPNIRIYELVYYRRWGAMFTAFILTFIGVAVSSVKKRGGMGVNLAFGVLIGFTYVFFERIFGILSEKSGISPLMAVIIPNLIFTILALYLLKTSRR